MRVFLALELNESAREKLVNVQEQIRSLNVTATYPEKSQLHVTLDFFGELSANQVRQKADELNGFSAKSFDTTLQGIGAFPKPDHVRVLWAGFTKGKNELKTLQENVTKALNRTSSAFHPHVTLARVKKVTERKKLNAFLAAKTNTPLTCFSAKTITLYESKKTPNGPIYLALSKTTKSYWITHYTPSPHPLYQTALPCHYTPTKTRAN
jgi:RNA 2',3'-cyclic 3'-phosphodiesterase